MKTGMLRKGEQEMRLAYHEYWDLDEGKLEVYRSNGILLTHDRPALSAHRKASAAATLSSSLTRNQPSWYT